MLGNLEMMSVIRVERGSWVLWFGEDLALMCRLRLEEEVPKEVVVFVGLRRLEMEGKAGVL